MVVYEKVFGSINIQECILVGCVAPTASLSGGAWPAPPQLPPGVLGVSLDQIPLNFPLGCGPGDPPSQTRHPHSPVDRILDTRF